MAPVESSKNDRRPDAPTRAPLWHVVGCLLVSVWPLVGGVGLGIPESRTLPPASIYANGGVGYAVSLSPSVLSPMFEVLSDDPQHPRRSTALLTEDSRVLGPPHSLHASIAGEGSGLFSHWGQSLLFAASDSTDPRANGRHYELHLRSRLPFMMAVIWVVCLATGALLTAPRLATDRWSKASATVAMVAAPAAGLALASVFIEATFAPAKVLALAWAMTLGASFSLAATGGRLLATQPIASPPWRAALRAVSLLVEPVLAPFDRPDWLGRLTRVATLCVAVAAFAVALRAPWSSALLRAFHDDHVMVVRWGLPLLTLALWRRGWVGVAASLAFVLVGVALPLAARWHDVGVHGNALGGLLPTSDAGGYWLEANRLLEGQPLQWAARRPAFTAFLSTVFAVTGRDLEWSLAILAAMNAVALALLGLELRRSFGPLAGAVGVVVLLTFYGFDGAVGLVLTENLGLATGALGFAALVRGSRESATWTYAAGVGLVTFALMARAGSFFVLPAIVVAAAWEFRPRWGRAAAQASAAILVAAALAYGSGRLISAPAGEQQAFSNFSYSLYGLVVGGKGWQQVIKDHPDAKEGAEIYGLAWRAFRDRPSGLLEGAVHMWTLYVDVTSTSAFHAFSFIRSPTPRPLLYSLCYVAVGVGLCLAVAGIHRPLRATLVAGLVGHLASIPFVPPIDAGLRVYAATMPFVAAILAFGVAEPLRVLARLVGGRRRPTSGILGRVEWPHAPLVLGIVIVAATTLAPQVLLRAGHVPGLPAMQCGPREVALAMRISPGAQLDVVADDGARPTGATIIQQDAIRRALETSALRGDAERVTAGGSLALGYDIRSGAFLWLLAPTAVLPRPGVYGTCAEPSVDPLARASGLYYGGSTWRALAAAR